MTKVLQLYPQPASEQCLDGLYLGHRIDQRGTQQTPFVYANFVTSLDGRIALSDTDGRSYVPSALTTHSDWQLFQELQAQADCFIIHGGYLRSLAAGILGNILQVGGRPESGHLLVWRKQHGLNCQPAIVVASASLDFPIPDSIKQHRQTLYIATGEKTDRDKVTGWQDQGFEIIIAGSGTTVEGGPLIRSLRERGYKRIYLQAGPRILETMLRDAVLSRLYLTISHQLFGGALFHTLLAGGELSSVASLELHTLYLEQRSPTTVGQFFACFDRVSHLD